MPLLGQKPVDTSIQKYAEDNTSYKIDKCDNFFRDVGVHHKSLYYMFASIAY